jgi:enoyl-[acyl-carrier-protein] reductase (NADH)
MSGLVDLAGKKGLIVGIANDQPFAYGCAQQMRSLATAEDIGALAAFLVSDVARATTGDIHYVDSGLHILS